jgi:hypothetical protein
MPKKLLATTIILTLILVLVIGLQAVEVEANPVPYPVEPTKELPTLNVISPQNGDIYSTNTVKMNFTVTTPASWNLYHLGIPVIGDYAVYIYLEGTNQTFIPYNPAYKNTTMNYSQDISGLANGEYTVRIEVRARTFYKNTNPEPHGLDYLFEVNNISETVHFTVNSESQPSNPQQSGNPQQSVSFPTVPVTAVFIAIALAGAGLLVYFKRRKGKP